MLRHGSNVPCIHHFHCIGCTHLLPWTLDTMTCVSIKLLLIHVLLATQRVQTFSTLFGQRSRRLVDGRQRRSNILVLHQAAVIDDSIDDDDEYEVDRPGTYQEAVSTESVTGMIKGYDPSEGLPESVIVGDPQIKVKEREERSVNTILRELAAIQQKGPQKYCILGTRHCSYLHQQIIELLAYALVLSGNHVYTSGAGGTHAATIRGALRAERPDLLTVILPQSMDRQTRESQSLLRKVTDVVSMPQNDDMPLDVASRICNSYLLNQTDQLISFAFHESTTVIEATKEAKKLDMLVTVLYLD